MNKNHQYTLQVNWTGNTGTGTDNYRSYNRNHTICSEGKPEILASSDPAFRGDRTRYNPEELLVASLSGCHMLWFLHLCAEQGVVVLDYQDKPTGLMHETAEGGGKFRGVTLNPVVTVPEVSMVHKTEALHRQAHKLCFIANSVNFPVELNATSYVAAVKPPSTKP